MDPGRLSSVVDGRSDRPPRRGIAVANIASVRDLRSDWRRWTSVERVLAVAIMAGLLAALASISELGGH